MDEPTAHLDPVGARQIGAAIDTALADRTVIVVTHGRGWTGPTDRVVRLDRGELLSPAGRASRAARPAAEAIR
jgi:ABC-type transport system involved in cytochrome bd biosynthesis fused ATPase/permease subunit